MKNVVIETTWLILVTGALAVACFLALSEPAQGAVTTRQYIEQIAAKEARARHLDPDLVIAIIQVESNFNPNAIGAAGEIGLMQLHPRYHAGVKNSIINNIRAGVSYLAHLRMSATRRYGPAWWVAFNVGPNSKIKSPKAQSYYKRVIAIVNARKGYRYVAR